MNIARRLLAPVAIQDRNNHVTSVDLGAFVARLILFDTYILQSIWLEDVILLQHSFGPAGLSRLLDSGALKFQCPDFTFGQTGQARSVFTREGQPPVPALPLFNYQFSVVRVQNADEKIERTLATLDSGLREQLMKNRIVIPEDHSKTVFEVFYGDLRTRVLDSAVRMELRRRGIVPTSHHLQVEKRTNDEFVVENDLSRKYLLPAQQAHQLLDSAMMAVGRLDERIASMQAYL